MKNLSEAGFESAWPYEKIVQALGEPGSGALSPLGAKFIHDLDVAYALPLMKIIQRITGGLGVHRDLYHESLLTLIPAIRKGNFKNEKGILPYLAQICRNKALHYLRTGNFYSLLGEELMQEIPDDQPLSPEHLFDQVDEQGRQKLKQLLDRVGCPCSKALKMKYGLGRWKKPQNGAEIGKRLGRSANNVYKLERRCRAKLFQLLADSNDPALLGLLSCVLTDQNVVFQLQEFWEELPLMCQVLFGHPSSSEIDQYKKRRQSRPELLHFEKMVIQWGQVKAVEGPQVNTLGLADCNWMVTPVSKTDYMGWKETVIKIMLQNGTWGQGLLR